MSKYILFGSGGHSKVILECLQSENKQVIGFFDDAPNASTFLGLPVFAGYVAGFQSDAQLIITIGNNKIRKLVSGKIQHAFGQTIFAKNIISGTARVSEGSMIMQGAILNADCVIGKHVIVNTRAVVEHDSFIDDFVHVAPGAVVCGNVRIGEGTLIGANAVIAPNITIGKWCQISAGSSVLENIPDNSIVMGVPGKIVNHTNN